MSKNYQFIEPLAGETRKPGNDLTYPDGTPRISALSNNDYVTILTKLIKGEYTNLFDRFKNLTNMILSIKSIPYDVYNPDSSSNIFTDLTNLYIGEELVKSNAPTLTQQAMGYDMSIAEFYFNRNDLDEILENSFLDYNSFSVYSLYLPFIGYINLEYESIKTPDKLCIEYYTDYTTCTMFCNVYLDYSGSHSVYIYENSVDIGHDLAVLSSDNTSYLGGLMIALGSVVTAAGVLTGNPVATTTGISTTISSIPAVNNTTTYRALNPKTNRIKSYSQTVKHTDAQDTKTTNKWKYSSYGNNFSATGELLNGVGHFMSSASNQSLISGGNTNSLLNSIRQPFIHYKHPITNYFNGYNHMYGRPLSQYKVLSSMSGFTKLSSIHLNIPATTSELEEIESLLYEGVIINNGTPSPEPPVNPEPPVEPEPPEPEPDPEPPTPEPDPEPDPKPPEEYRPYEEGKEMICCFNGRFRVTSPRGWRTLNGVRDYHKGIDLVGEDSHVVYAICDGYCTTRTQYNDEGKMDGFGHYVTQTIADGRRVFYAHLASFSITDNQYVTAGTPIGIMGATGNVTGAHTHLELRPAGTTSESLDINAFTGIPNAVGNYTGVPTYKVEGSAELQAKVGLENQTMEYLNDYEYAEDLVRKLNDKIE